MERGFRLQRRRHSPLAFAGVRRFWELGPGALGAKCCLHSEELRWGRCRREERANGKQRTSSPIASPVVSVPTAPRRWNPTGNKLQKRNSLQNCSPGVTEDCLQGHVPTPSGSCSGASPAVPQPQDPRQGCSPGRLPAPLPGPRGLVRSRHICLPVFLGAILKASR